MGKKTVEEFDEVKYLIKSHWVEYDYFLISLTAAITGIVSLQLYTLLQVNKIDFYRNCISPLMLPGKCRFYPTCSQYCKEAIQKYGAIKGSYLGIKRILRCHPGNPGGYDPVP